MALDKFSRGSEWRKWDLHVHTPGTKKNDQYRLDEGDVWTEFCKKIEESDVKSFGVTDYFSVDGYFNFLGQFKAKYPKSEKLFLPNIELCTSDVVNGAGEEVNLHIVFNPDFFEIDAKMREFLQNLKTNKTSQGRNIKASELSNTNDFEEATTTRAFIHEALQNTFGDKIDLTEILMVVTSVNNDGLRTATEEVDGVRRGKKRKVVITDELDKFSQAFFGNSHSTEYFLDKDRLEVDEEIDKKPVVTGSDSHSFNDLDNWLGKVVFKDGKILKESTWIKADLTFEGLRQLIFEPEQRVFIGENPDIETRVKTYPRRYLESIIVGQIEGYDERFGVWFKDEEIPLNKELIAIIGNKGSGKSALTDILGLVGNSHNQKYERNGKTEELFSFLNKDKFLKGRRADNFSGTLRWYSGDPDTKTLEQGTDISTPEEVEYLPQKYLEKICSNIEDDEFRQKLNEVIFEYVGTQDRHGKQNLEDLISYLSDQTEEDIRIASEGLHSKNEVVVALEKKLSFDYQKDIIERLRLKTQEVEAHEKIKPSAVTKPGEGDQSHQGVTEISKIESEVNDLNKQISVLKTEQSNLSTQVEELKQFRQAIERQKESLVAIDTKYKTILETAGLNFGDIASITTNYSKLDVVVGQKASRLNEVNIALRSQEDIKLLALETDQESEALKSSLVCQVYELETKKNRVVEQLDKPNRDFQAYMQAQEKWELRKKALEGENDSPELDTLRWLEQEKNKISSDYLEGLKLARQDRDLASKTIFEKKKGLIAFYDTVKQSIDKEIEKYGDELGDYDISIETSLRFDSSFYDDFFKYISQSVKGSFYEVERGRSALMDLVSKVSEWEKADEVFKLVGEIQSSVDNDNREGLVEGENKSRDIFKQLKQNKNPVDFYDFLYGFGYLETKYDLEVDGKDLSELSPGERGGVLLIFYLMLDRRNIPLIIDQPEDNLDNKSVFEVLVTFLKKAKKRRQIIIATHNPNLAVVADAEQIIRVSIDKKRNNDFDFYSGSIENPRINKEVVDILEGTLPAFDNRRLKYRKVKK